MIFKKKNTRLKLIWKDANIPAKLFFEILQDSDYTKIGSGPVAELEKAFDTIVDEFVLLDGNSTISQWYQKKGKIALINLQIQTISNILYAITYMNLTEDQRLHLVKSINSIEGVNIKFNADKPMIDEISRVQNTVLGTLKTRLNMELSTERKQGENIQFSFEKDLVLIENTLGRTINDDVSLRKYSELKKSAQEKAKHLKQANRKHGKQ